MVVTEALARGIPVLATAAGALPDTLGHAPDGSRPGLLVAARRPRRAGGRAAGLVRRSRHFGTGYGGRPASGGSILPPVGAHRATACTRCWTGCAASRSRRRGDRTRPLRAAGFDPGWLAPARTGRPRGPGRRRWSSGCARRAGARPRCWCTISAPAPARCRAGWRPGCPARSAGCCTTTTRRCWPRPRAAAPGCATPTGAPVRIETRTSDLARLRPRRPGRRRPGHRVGAARPAHRGRGGRARRGLRRRRLPGPAHPVGGRAGRARPAGPAGRARSPPRSTPTSAAVVAGRRLLGPDAPAAAAAAFARHGMAVRTAASPWRLGRRHAAAARALAARLGGGRRRPATLTLRGAAAGYLADRLPTPVRLTVLVQHHDLLALPTAPAQRT